jgi:tetratricopeptide (TPR) repeat protein
MGSEGGPQDALHEALKQGLFKDAIHVASEISREELEPQQLAFLMDALLAAAAGLADNSREELHAYNLVISLGDELGDQDIYRAAAQLKLNSALFNKGVLLAQVGRWKEAIAVYDDLIVRTGGAGELGLRENAVRALFNKGASLAGHELLEDAIAVYDEILDRFAGETERTLNEAVGKALINKGVALAELDRVAEAVAVLDEVVARWGDSADPLLRERASRALLNKAAALVQLHSPGLAVEAYDEIESRFGGDKNPVLQECVKIAQASKATLEASLN